MEDVNPLIENNKLPHIQNGLVKWKSQTIFLFFKSRYHLVACLTGVSVAMVLLLLLSFLFTGDVDCPDSWSRLDGHCYSLLTGYHEMSVCRADCLTHGGDLASIHSGRENEFLADLIKNRPVRGGEKDTWIAGKVTEIGGNFSWLDGTSWDYQNWDTGEPDRKSVSYKQHHECVFIGKNLNDLGKWWDGVCTWTRWSFDCLCKI